MSAKVNVAVIGASGYTGLELIKILIAHPHFEIAYVATSEGDVKLTQLHPSLYDIIEADVEKASAEAVAASCDLAFLALPHKTAMGFVKELMALSVKTVDLSADYRLERETYEMHYCEHTDPENLPHAVYGLPELQRDAIRAARLVANPGCYPTASILAALPFMFHRREGTPIVIDAKSGVSGAGKKCIHNTHYVTINENLFSYNPLGHRHGPEIAEKLKVAEEEVHFVPHLVPATRGMLVSVYLQVEEDFDPIEVLERYYAEERFVRVRDVPVDMKSVAGTNFCDIYAKRQGNLLFVSAAIDNLLRGASSQAVANANLMMGFEESAGLPLLAYVP